MQIKKKYIVLFLIILLFSSCAVLKKNDCDCPKFSFIFENVNYSSFFS